MFGDDHRTWCLRWPPVVRGSTRSSQTCRRAKRWLLNAAVVCGGIGSLRTPLPLTMADGWKAPLISLMSQPDNQPARYRSFEPLPDLARPVSTGGLQFPVLVQRRLAFIQLGGVVR